MFEMDWANESYCRTHIRDTVAWLKLPWTAQALWLALLRKMDRSGVIEAPDGAEDVAVLLRWPEEIVADGLKRLMAVKGGLLRHPRGYIWPEYIPAQETAKSDKLRARESRERVAAREIIAAELGGHAESQPVTNCDAVTKRDTESQNERQRHERSREHTAGHAESHRVTLTCPDPSSADLVSDQSGDPDARAGASAREARTGPDSPDVPCGTVEEAEPEEDPIDFQRELLRRAAVDEMTEEQWAEWDRKVIANRSAHPIPHTGTRRANA